MKTRLVLTVLLTLVTCSCLVAEEIDIAAIQQAQKEIHDARDKFEKVIEKCMDSDKDNGYAHIDHNDSSFGIQVMCKKPKPAIAYLKAASAIFEYTDEPYKRNHPEINVTRRVFDQNRNHLCFFRGKAEDEDEVVCYFKLVLPGLYKQKMVELPH